jgi:hypothetical protein
LILLKNQSGVVVVIERQRVRPRLHVDEDIEMKIALHSMMTDDEDEAQHTRVKRRDDEYRYPFDFLACCRMD